MKKKDKEIKKNLRKRRRKKEFFNIIKIIDISKEMYKKEDE